MPSVHIRASEKRIREGFSVRALAKHLNVTPQTVHRWEVGSIPRPGALVALAGFLGEDPVALKAEMESR